MKIFPLLLPSSLVSIIVSGANGRSMEVAYTFWGNISE